MRRANQPLLLAGILGFLTLIGASLAQAALLSDAGNPPVPVGGSSTNVPGPVESQGLLMEVWSNIAGTNLASLTQDPRFQTNAPDLRILATAADTETVFLENVRTNFGTRLSGFLAPRNPARYEFFLRSQDNAELSLSPDENPDDLVTIAAESTCCHEFLEPGAPQTSAAIVLMGGRRYALEVLVKAGAAGGYAQVAWRKENDPTPAADLAPIPGEFLVTQWGVTNGPPILTTRPHGTTVALGGTGQLTGEALIGDKPIGYQWSLAGKAIPGATNTALVLTNFAVTNTGLYTLTATNAAGSASAMAGLFPLGSLYIEAEDFNFAHGQYVTNQPIGMTGPYRGDAYRGLGASQDADVDWHATGRTNQFYRPGTGVLADQENLQADWFPRDVFQLEVNNVVLSNPGEWYDYTRVFPSTPKDYYVLGRCASTNAINLQLDEVTARVSTNNQVLQKLGQFRPGRPTSSSTNYEFFPLVDASGQLMTVTNWGGEKTFRITVLTNRGQNLDYFMFVPVVSEVAPGGSFTSVTVKNGNLILTWSSGTLESADNVNGPWTSLPNVTSPATIPMTEAKAFYRVHPSPVTSPSFTSVVVKNGNLVLTWSSGTLESADNVNGPWTSLPNVTSPATIPMTEAKKFYRLSGGAVTPPATFTSVTVKNGNLVLTWTSGTLESADNVNGPWTSLPNVTSPATIPMTEAKKFYRLSGGAVTTPPTFTSVTAKNGNLVLTWTSGTLESADSVNGPWTSLPNVTSPATIPMTEAKKFYRLSGGAVTTPPTFTSVTAKNGNVVLAWSSGTLESADSVAGPWTPVPGAVSPLTIPATAPRKFYRVR